MDLTGTLVRETEIRLTYYKSKPLKQVRFKAFLFWKKHFICNFICNMAIFL